ncbi:MAG: hypothetical protein KBF93_00680 [Leptospiraceae bacterium]|nr:hypothetical protein [Leptospiraceae bacterium]
MKYIYYLVSLVLILLITISFVYFSSNFKNNSANKNDGFSRGVVEKGSGSLRKSARQRSLFEEDSKFLEFPDMGMEEADSSDLTPEEKERRKKLIIEKSKKLAEMFPHNSVIPRELSLEESKKVNETKERMAMIQNNFLQNETVSKEDKIFYYNQRLKISKDRLEIFRYALGLQNGGNFDESKLDGFLKERYESILENEKAYSEEITKIEKE